MSQLASSVHAVVIGAGLHGLSTGWHHGLDSLALSRAEMAGDATRVPTLGVNCIGSCCGSIAHHVRAMAEALGRRPPASAKSADLARHPGIQKSRTLEAMAGVRPKSADAPRFATGARHW
jgi:hypothetical protein